jgi:hypothetical protein
MSPEARAVSSRLRELQLDIAADLEAVRKLHGELCAARDESVMGLPAKARAALLAVALHGYYGAVEAALLCVAKDLDGAAPSGRDWHRTLLDRMGRDLTDVRPSVLGADSLALLRRLLGFRHFFRHAYAVDLDLTLLEEHATAVRDRHDGLVRELEGILTHLAAVAAAVRYEDAGG